MPMTREQIEAARAEAAAARAAQGGGRQAGAAGTPNQSRLTLARAAVRPEMKGRVMLSGPPGAGKTYTALVIATILVGPAGRILVVDSEKESSLTYADVFEFEQLPWNPPYDPTALSLTLKEAAETYDCIIVDSFSHFWRKQGGVLDIAGDNVRGWKAARPIQENLIETILDIEAHVIVCCRSKMDHLIETDRAGKVTVTKAGIKAQQDDDLEYEVNVALELDMPHVLHIVKSRTNAVPVGAQFLAGLAGDFAQQYRDWLKTGEPVADKAATDALRLGLDQIEDEGERRRAKAQFLDTFGRPEFLLVSRLEEARDWVIRVVTGTLPVDRAPDEVPAERSEGIGDDEPPAGPGSPTGSGAASTPAASQAGEAAERGPGQPADETRPPGPAPAETTAQADEPVELAPTEDGLGDIGHCVTCGTPIWADAGGMWRHADEPHGPAHDPEPLPPEADADAVAEAWVAAHPHPPTGSEVLDEINGLSTPVLINAMGEAGLSLIGSPKVLRARYTKWRLEQEAKAAATR